ncbi:MAG: ATP-dependent helicase, partial [Porphyromonadaceae bacterium]|nr:ATP-dependent helicase [Porphyromonadaceae bacterium]
GKPKNTMDMYETLCNSRYIPSDITAITFRKSSANDLINKVSLRTKMPADALKEHVGTIHSICNRLSGRGTPLAASDLNKFVKEHKYMQNSKQFQSNLDNDDQVYTGNLFDLYTWMRNTQTPQDKLYAYPGFNELGQDLDVVQTFINDYEQYKIKNNKIDFTDMLQRVIESETPLDTPVLIIDEFQDLTLQMYQVFKLWFPQCEVVIIAGDPLQSIYGYMGGSPRYYMDFAAKEIILKKSYRLPSQIWEYAKTILRYEGMQAPDVVAKAGYKTPIQELHWNDSFPTYESELHLVRCNYQSQAVAMSLANSGKLFGGLHGWTAAELNLAKAIINFRSGVPLTVNDTLTLAENYPVKYFGSKHTEESISQAIKNYFNTSSSSSTLSAWSDTSMLTPKIRDSLSSDDPTNLMNRNSKLFTAKIRGIMDSRLKLNYIPKNAEGNYPIVQFDGKYLPDRNLLTIHGAKGLEANAVFLHTAITPRIQKAIVIPGEESAAEARVWYVGATRSRDTLYIVKDAGKNYSLPEVSTC